jgi:hypothetical protein
MFANLLGGSALPSWGGNQRTEVVSAVSASKAMIKAYAASLADRQPVQVIEPAER